MSTSPFPSGAPASVPQALVRPLTRRTLRRASRRGLRPIEAALLVRYRDPLAGAVLELGARGDGLTAALVHHAGEYTGICRSATEAAHCSELFPAATFRVREPGELDEFLLAEFDAVVAGRFALDHLGDEARRQALEQAADLLARDGVLILSSHNLARESRIPSPVADLARRPWRLLSLPQAVANRTALRAHQQRGHGYGLLNDPSAHFSRLTYYVSRAQQERQLNDCDFQLLECLDRSGDPVGPTQFGAAELELHYIAARAV